MKIGEAARRSGVPAKTIRYYESTGLIDAAERESNGYRDYDERDVRILRFVHRARRLGFPVKDVARLLTLWSDRNRASADVKAVAREHLHEVELRIRELETIRGTLLHLMHECHGDDRPDCPILDELAGPAAHPPKGEEP
jgi:MerR family copper efflux transcriptional regulator